MYNNSSKKVWYGKLNTPTGAQIVIYDAALPLPPKGRVLFYNAERNVFLEYMEKIVQGKLSDLNTEEMTLYKNQYKSAWSKARKKYLSAQKKYQPSATQAQPKKIEEPKESADDFDGGDDFDFSFDD